MNKILIWVIPVAIGVLSGSIMALSINDDAQNLGDKITAKTLTQNGSPILGNPSAPITLLEWGDYQCTFCFRFHDSSLKSITKEYIESGKVKLVFKDFPLNGPDSVRAAEASYCAGDQGKYWQYHDELYKNWGGERTGWITENSLRNFAKNIGLDLDQFNKCLEDKKYFEKIINLEREGREMGVDATPSFYVFNDKKIVKITGNQPLEVFKKVLDEF